MLANGTTVIIFPLRGKVSPLLARTARNDINFHFPGGTYVPDGGARADFTWEVLASGFTRARGIYGTAFGTPIAPVAHTGWLTTRYGIGSIPIIATGATTTTFGDPRVTRLCLATPALNGVFFGTAEITPHVMPIYSTVFGTPNSPYLQTCVPNGFTSTGFGTPREVEICYVSATLPSTVFSTAYTPTNRTVEASSRAPTTALGSPVATRRAPGGSGVFAQAFGFTSTQLGLPAAAWRQSVTATGFTATTFGEPARGGTRLATGFSKTRFGRPRASIRFNTRYASGSTSTNFGTPSSTIKNRVTSLGILGAFGTPLLQRSTTC